MGAANRKSPCHFDALFTKTNVPHILEKIFFNLDYESYKKCIEVNSTWNKLLTSERYRRKAKHVFHEDIQKDEDKLVGASGGGQAEEVLKLLSSGLVDVNCDNGHSPALRIAALYGRKKVVKILIDKGADPNAADQWGQIPLRTAVTHGHEDIVQMLLERGAEPNKMNNDMWTSLHKAARWGCPDMVKVLLDGGANRHITTSGGDTPTEVAARYGSNEVVQLLSHYGN